MDDLTLTAFVDQAIQDLEEDKQITDGPTLTPEAKILYDRLESHLRGLRKTIDDITELWESDTPVYKD